MKILVMGGTGAIGTPLVDILSKMNLDIDVTTRKNKISKNKNVNYVCGNAKDINFITSLLNKKYDIIIDFMAYTTQELKERMFLLLDNCNQYFFFSSSRVYANSKERIVEGSERLLDSCKDLEYLKTDEYALAKAREEDLFINCSKTNWTVIRPYITYNAYRLQLGVYEKEHWLSRVLNGKAIVFPKDIANCTTSLTYGMDVASAVAKLIGKDSAKGEIYHIVTEQTFTWDEILNCYLDVLEKKMGKRPKVMYVNDSSELQKIWVSPWQIKYDRLFNRSFDDSKIISICGKIEFKDISLGLEECLIEFLDNPVFLDIDPLFEAWCDRKTCEWSKFKDISGVKNKIKYFVHRIFG